MYIVYPIYVFFIFFHQWQNLNRERSATSFGRPRDTTLGEIVSGNREVHCFCLFRNGLAVCLKLVVSLFWTGDEISQHEHPFYPPQALSSTYVNGFRGANTVLTEAVESESLIMLEEVMKCVRDPLCVSAIQVRREDREVLFWP